MSIELPSSKLCFDVFYRDEKTGRVELDGIKVLKNECYLKGNEPYPFIKYPFINMKDNGYIIRKWLEDRAIPPNRADIKEILKVLGLREYNAFDILKKLHGSDVNDFVWMKFDDIPGDKGLTFKDIHWRA